uniref:Hexosyltransferase n=1 Tax=Trieres chinensis TaxID=1514140 RepID=A0A7S2EAE1_TRICV|mmetsp:Transcript_14188/g.29179  ORF Transcript_14188/g.29179 Transcript_14188/m.29179 type:complete len:267 (+) Transcript_14188:226-1026(+)
MLADDHGGAVCSLGTFLEEGTRGDGPCRLAYAFVDAGPPPQPPSSSSPSGIVDGDVAYLGLPPGSDAAAASLAWFEAATLSLATARSADYVARSDRNTLMSMRHLLRHVDGLRPAPSPPGHDRRGIYGGAMVDRDGCGWDVPPCEGLIGRTFMDGEFYYLSSDLARYASSEQAGEIPKGGGIREDYIIGTRAASRPGPIRMMSLGGNRFWYSGDDLGTEAGWMTQWNEMEEVALIRGLAAPELVQRPKLWPGLLRDEGVAYIREAP